jgi:putative transposase
MAAPRARQQPAPAATAPGAKPLTVYGWRGKGHLPALLRRSLEHAQYTAIRYTERLEETKAVRSVGSKGDSYDNAAAESLNSLYKRELIDFRKGWQGVDDVMLATMDWVSWYNEDRLHSYCGDMPPKEYEEIHYKALESGKIKDSSQT